MAVGEVLTGEQLAEFLCHSRQMGSLCQQSLTCMANARLHTRAVGSFSEPNRAGAVFFMEMRRGLGLRYPLRPAGYLVLEKPGISLRHVAYPIKNWLSF
jgi:hypothetical protein